jgi:hypothetical protein
MSNTLIMLKQQETNLLEMYTNYLAILEKHYPRYTPSEIDQRSNVASHLCTLIQRNERNIRYAEENEDWNYHYFNFNDSVYEEVKKRHDKKATKYTKAFLSMIKVRKSLWRTPSGVDMEIIEKTNTINLACWYVYFDPRIGSMSNSKDTLNYFKSYLSDPIFGVGDIVSIRANIPEGSIKKRYNWGHGKDLRIVYDRETLKGKPLMVLGESDASSQYYERTYKPNANGGMRRYMVLPVGETTIYHIIERALKKNRTKAVKDAKRT